MHLISGIKFVYTVCYSYRKTVNLWKLVEFYNVLSVSTFGVSISCTYQLINWLTKPVR